MNQNRLEIYGYTKPKKSFLKIFLGFFAFMVLVLVFFVFYMFAPVTLAVEKTITIPDGYSVIGTTKLLQEQGIVRSQYALRAVMQIGKLSPKAGPYSFKNMQNLKDVAMRLDAADYGDVYVNITIPEGSTNKQILNIIKNSEFAVDDVAALERMLSENEGYFFPDTYSFLPGTTGADIIKKMQETFNEKKAKATANKSIQKTDREIVIMASILEKEATSDLQEKQIISGILWKRIREGMLLQVDAPFLYERGQGSADLSIADLRKDSPYNTYTNPGLTPTAIGNPGYDTLYAAAHPVESDYYFYLHAPDGSIYYGKNYNEHLKNIRMYLK